MASRFQSFGPLIELSPIMDNGGDGDFNQILNL